jgi:hypothetical protein
VARRNVVLLLPGFFGFNRVSLFSYFVDRVSASLRGALDFREGSPTPVVSLSAPPAGDLVERQRALLAQLHWLDQKLGADTRLHLVAHSAGGVDAYLLTCQRAMIPEGFSPQDDRLRRRIQSVTTVATPFFGTGLTTAAIAKFAVHPRHNLASVRGLLKLASELTSGRALDPILLQRAASVAVALPDAARFCFQLLAHRGLISALTPDRMAELMTGNRRIIPAKITNFVTVVPKDRLVHAAPFFADLWALTADSAASAQADSMAPRPPGAAVRGAIELLDKSAAAVVGSPGAPLPAFDLRASDGVVNSAYQLAEPWDPATLGGIVVADHADVLGYYDGVDALIHGPPLNESVFRSGAGFGDDEFFELYRRVAEAIAEAIAEPRPSSRREVRVSPQG